MGCYYTRIISLPAHFSRQTFYLLVNSDPNKSVKPSICHLVGGPGNLPIQPRIKPQSGMTSIRPNALDLRLHQFGQSPFYEHPSKAFFSVVH